MLAIARYGCALRRGREAPAFARHKQSSGLCVSGLSLDRTPFERAARSRPKNSHPLSPLAHLRMADNGSDTGRSKNRRVEILLRELQTAATSAD